MEDAQIIRLFWERNEEAIRECRDAYGRYCRSIAGRILSRQEDLEECLNDTWLRAWNSIPPQKPQKLAVFLGTITRNLSLDRLRREKRMRRGGGEAALCLEELEECIGEEQPIEDRLALRETLNRFLSGLSEDTRRVFQMRYWYMMPVSEIASREKKSESAVKMLLLRTRRLLADFLKQEGYS